MSACSLLLSGADSVAQPKANDVQEYNRLDKLAAEHLKAQRWLEGAAATMERMLPLGKRIHGATSDNVNTFLQ